jgi:hypothetical protein
VEEIAEFVAIHHTFMLQTSSSMQNHIARLQRFLLTCICCGLPLAWWICLAGCGSNSKLSPVEGIVRLDGKPLSTGTVRFVPTAGRAAEGKIRSDGTFQLGTYAESDGAVIGSHQVAIIAVQTDPDAPKDGRMLKGNPKVRKLIPKRYMATATSGLTAEVKPGKNDIAFDLTSP